MSASNEATSQNVGEKGARFFRNINALGAAAIGGAALLIPGPNVILASWAGINAVQAGGWEIFRRAAEKRRKKDR